MAKGFKGQKGQNPMGMMGQLQKLQEQLGHGAYAASAAWPRPRNQASQQARASARTRPI